MFHPYQDQNNVSSSNQVGVLPDGFVAVGDTRLRSAMQGEAVFGFTIATPVQFSQQYQPNQGSMPGLSIPQHPVMPWYSQDPQVPTEPMNRPVQQGNRFDDPQPRKSGPGTTLNLPSKDRIIAILHPLNMRSRSNSRHFTRVVYAILGALILSGIHIMALLFGFIWSMFALISFFPPNPTSRVHKGRRAAVLIAMFCVFMVMNTMPG